MSSEIADTSARSVEGAFPNALIQGDERLSRLKRAKRLLLYLVRAHIPFGFIENTALCMNVSFSLTA